MISRRESFKVFASGAAMGLTGAVIVSTASCAPTEAPAAIHDPLLALITEYRAARADACSWNFTGSNAEEDFEALCQRTVDPLFLRLAKDPPPATTAAGAIAALKMVEEAFEEGDSLIDKPMLNAVMAYLEGRAA